MIVVLAGGISWAQAPAKPANNSSAQSSAKSTTAAKPVAAAAPTKVDADVPTKTAAKSKTAGKKVASKKTDSVMKTAAVKEEQTATRVSAVPKPGTNKRDPFVSPLVKTGGGAGPVCETGKRCLLVDQIDLKGIVKSPNGFIAVVENAAKRAYFLRENDPVFNGSVIKITGDSVTFREQVTDKLGKQATRDVVKKVNAPVV